MTAIFLPPTAVRAALKHLSCGILIAGLTTALPNNASALPTGTVDLGGAASFAVLAGSGINIGGASTITGDIGTAPTATITGLANLTLHGVNHSDDDVTDQAKLALLGAYGDAAARPIDHTYAAAFDLAGLSLTAGVYHGTSSLFLSGALTLDGEGNPDAVWIFQTGSTFITDANSAVTLIGGAKAENVFWQIGSSATFGADTAFIGNLLVHDSITLGARASIDGRALALGAAVTLADNIISLPLSGTPAGVPDSGSTLWLLGSGVAVIWGFRRRVAMPG